MQLKGVGYQVLAVKHADWWAFLFTTSGEEVIHVPFASFSEQK